MNEKGKFCYKYARPAVTADCVVLSNDENGALQVLLIKRLNEPFKGSWALPGGFININESAENAARRELEEETGLIVDGLKQIGAYSAPDRDPRDRIITIAYVAVLVTMEKVKGGDDAAAARWFPLSALPPLAFDHEKILHDALKFI